MGNLKYSIAESPLPVSFLWIWRVFAEELQLLVNSKSGNITFCHSLKNPHNQQLHRYILEETNGFGELPMALGSTLPGRGETNQGMEDTLISRMHFIRPIKTAYLKGNLALEEMERFQKDKHVSSHAAELHAA